jgi:hypothetical protein
MDEQSILDRSEAEVFVRRRQGMTIVKQTIFGGAGSAKE